MRKRRAGSGQRGFSLVEVLAASALLAITGFAALTLLGAAWQAENAARRVNLAADALESVLERVRALKVESIVSVSRQPVPGFPGLSYETQVTEYGQGPQWKDFLRVRAVVYLDADPAQYWSQEIYLSPAVASP